MVVLTDDKQKRLFEITKNDVKDFLVVSKTGVEFRKLERELEENMGYPPQYKKLGYETWGDFIYAIQDILEVGHLTCEPQDGFRTRFFLFIKDSVFANCNADQVDMANMVRGQEKAKTKKRSDGTTNHPTKRQVRFVNPRCLIKKGGFGGSLSKPPPLMNGYRKPYYGGGGGSSYAKASTFPYGKTSSSKPSTFPYGRTSSSKPSTFPYGLKTSSSQGSTFKSFFQTSDRDSDDRPPPRAFGSVLPAGMEEDDSGDDDEDVFDYCGGGVSSGRPKPIPESEWTLEVPRVALPSAPKVAALPAAPKVPVQLFPRAPVSALPSTSKAAALPAASKVPVQLFPRAPALSSAPKVAAPPAASKVPVQLFPRAPVPALPSTSKVAALPVASKAPVLFFPRVAPKPPVAVRVDIKVAKAQNEDSKALESDEEFLSLSEERRLVKNRIITSPKDLPVVTSSVDKVTEWSEKNEIAGFSESKPIEKDLDVIAELKAGHPGSARMRLLRNLREETSKKLNIRSMFHHALPIITDKEEPLNEYHPKIHEVRVLRSIIEPEVAKSHVFLANRKPQSSSSIAKVLSSETEQIPRITQVESLAVDTLKRQPVCVLPIISPAQDEEDQGPVRRLTLFPLGEEQLRYGRHITNGNRYQQTYTAAHRQPGRPNDRPLTPIEQVLRLNLADLPNRFDTN